MVRETTGISCWCRNNAGRTDVLLLKGYTRHCWVPKKETTLLLLRLWWWNSTTTVTGGNQLYCCYWEELLSLVWGGRQQEGEGETPSFFFCEDEVVVHNDVLLCDVLFFDEELKLLGVGIKEWKVSDGEEIEIGEEKKKKGWKGRRLV